MNTSYLHRTLFTLIIVLSFFSCNNSKSIHKKYFEGTVTYKVNYNSEYENFTNEYLQDEYGSKMVMTIKEGNIYKKAFNPNGQVVSEKYLILNDKKNYSKAPNQDTIYWFDITKQDTKQTFNLIADSIILNEASTGIRTEGIVSGVGFGDKTFEVSGTYYFSKKYLVNPDWYSNFKEANFDEIIKIGKGIQVLLIENNGVWIKTTKIESIKPSLISDSVFLFDKENSILKEL